MNKRHFLRTIAALPAVVATPACLQKQVAYAVTPGAPRVLSSDGRIPDRDARHNILPTDRVFAPTSFWYQPIAADAPLHPLSALYVSEINRQIKKYYNGVGVNTTMYASPVYVVGTDVPPVAVKKDPDILRVLTEHLSAVPIPDYAIPAKGRDMEMTIWRPATDEMWELWKGRKDPVTGQWMARWGGRMRDVTKSSGIWATKAPFMGTTATGLPFLGGQVTAEELQRGEIRHVIGIALPNCARKPALSWPAFRGDGWNQDKVENPIPQGTRLRLDPTVDLSVLKMHPIARTVAKAAQKYGFVVWDTAGAAGLRFQNPYSYTQLGRPNPYTELFAGTASYNLLRSIPWNRLQFMPKDYGKTI